MACKPYRSYILLAAALALVATPCLAAIPGPRTPCPMSGCGNAEGASLDALRPCCCASPIAPAPGTGVATLLGAPHPVSILDQSLTFVAAGAPIARAHEEISHGAEHVPLFLLNASLLI